MQDPSLTDEKVLRRIPVIEPAETLITLRAWKYDVASLHPGATIEFLQLTWVGSFKAG